MNKCKLNTESVEQNRCRIETRIKLRKEIRRESRETKHRQRYAVRPGAMESGRHNPGGQATMRITREQRQQQRLVRYDELMIDFYVRNQKGYVIEKLTWQQASKQSMQQQANKLQSARRNTQMEERTKGRRKERQTERTEQAY